MLTAFFQARHLIYGGTKAFRYGLSMIPTASMLQAQLFALLCARELLALSDTKRADVGIECKDQYDLVLARAMASIMFAEG